MELAFIRLKQWQQGKVIRGKFFFVVAYFVYILQYPSSLNIFVFYDKC